MNRNVVRINSKLYFDLFKKGGDRLIAFYCMLKNVKGREEKLLSFKSKNNKNVSGISLIRNKTGFTLHTIKKYVPTLIEMGLLSFECNGNVCLLGNRRSKILYSSYKMIPIIIGDSITQTALNAFAVRVDSAQRQQKKMIDKKIDRRVLLNQAVNPSNLRLYKKALKFKKKYGDIDLTIVEQTVLSNEGFSNLKSEANVTKSKGAYWKRKLKKSGLITTERRFEKIKKMSYKDYLKIKLSGHHNTTYTYYKKYLVKELISSFNSTLHHASPDTVGIHF